ncbi:MAG: hypothetical protein RIS84_1770 [Pseudomonadota bacterium]|jgi:hypothetical protein
MAKTKILITVKTYPTISEKYSELVCTAGFREDGTWVRIYPIPFRKLDYDAQYRKYQWIELELIKNESDFRPESYSCHFSHADDVPTVLDSVGTENNWKVRKELCLKKVYDDLSVLISEAKNNDILTSLAVFKPAEIIDVICERVERNWSDGKLEALKQQNLFDEQADNDFKPVRKLPYKFSYKFRDKNGTESTLMIGDWEIGMLYWNCLKRSGGDEQVALSKVRQKYFDTFVNNNEVYLFLGTTKEHHIRRSKNPFIIVGVFYPPKSPQQSLF